MVAYVYLLNLKLTICLHIYIQKLKLKILSLQKLIEQLRAEIKEKTNTITELEEKLKVQVKIFVAAEPYCHIKKFNRKASILHVSEGERGYSYTVLTTNLIGYLIVIYSLAEQY